MINLINDNDNDKLDLLDGSYSISNIQGYFEYVFKKTMKWLIIHQ